MLTPGMPNLQWIPLCPLGSTRKMFPLPSGGFWKISISCNTTYGKKAAR